MTMTLRTPFRLDGGSVQTTYDYTRRVEQKIVNVMVTRTLERVGIPSYGGNVAALVFEQLDTLEFQDFKVDLASEVARRVSGVSILDIRIGTEDMNATITVRYSLPLTGPKTFTFDIDSLNEETPL